ncbi:hypothetical protein HMPREF2641_08080 [Lactobacillus sp. HMSC068B07]|nr:hypothetical protein HMPREF2641_08080 [Lactobacillus sp. HMSC068B07]
MSNETKREVFEYYLDMIKALKDPLTAECLSEAIQRYDAALPDDLPTIPLAVSEEIKGSYGSLSLRDELESVDSTSDDFSVVDYIENSESVFAEAWSRGLWIVEETGEVTGYDGQ